MLVTPDLQKVLADQGPATHMALSVELLADMETPISLYQKLGGDSPYTFLLESAAGGEAFGRYSFIGCGASTRFEFKNGQGTIWRDQKTEHVSFDNPLSVLEKLLASYRVVPQEGLPRFQGGAVGYLGYDCVQYFEDIPLPESSVLDYPEGSFLLVDEVVIFDHLKHRVVLVIHIPLAGDRRAHYQRGQERLAALSARLDVSLPPEKLFAPAGSPALLPWQANLSRDEFETAVRQAREAIVAGEVFQVVLSQRLTVEVGLPPFEVYRSLRALNPSPYMFYFNFAGWSIVGASPEVLVRLERDEILLRPIAGTRPRGQDRGEDEVHARDLLADEKELAEHHMLLDLGRNDVGRMAQIGTVRVEDPLHIEYYSHVMHLVSDIRGQVAPGRTAFDVLRACFPAGTVSGAPKIRAMELISSLEADRRGLYAGAVGYFDFTGNMDMCIAIRTLLVAPEKAYLQVGAGIVFDSDPAREYEECMSKAQGPLAALALTKERLRGRS